MVVRSPVVNPLSGRLAGQGLSVAVGGPGAA